MNVEMPLSRLNQKGEQHRSGNAEANWPDSWLGIGPLDAAACSPALEPFA
jgi:hypothetical protein